MLSEKKPTLPLSRRTVLGGFGSVFFMFGVPGTKSKDGIQGAFSSVLNGGGAKPSTEEMDLEARKAASSKARKELMARRKDLLSDLKAFDEQLIKELAGLKKLLLAGDAELEIPQVLPTLCDIASGVRALMHKKKPALLHASPFLHVRRARP
jgi:hypothetical protein